MMLSAQSPFDDRTPKILGLGVDRFLRRSVKILQDPMIRILTSHHPLELVQKETYSTFKTAMSDLHP